MKMFILLVFIVASVVGIMHAQVDLGMSYGDLSAELSKTVPLLVQLLIISVVSLVLTLLFNWFLRKNNT